MRVKVWVDDQKLDKALAAWAIYVDGRLVARAPDAEGETPGIESAPALTQEVRSSLSAAAAAMAALGETDRFAVSEA
jgi:hypothetical protein